MGVNVKSGVAVDGHRHTYHPAVYPREKDLSGGQRAGRVTDRVEAAFWIMGKAYQALEEQRLEHESFKAAFDIQREWPDVAREYAGPCLTLGLGKDAVIATKHAISLSPNDAGLRANLALAYLAIGKNDEADAAISMFLAMDPDDKISKSIREMVDDVLAGKRRHMKNKSDSKKKQ